MLVVHLERWQLSKSGVVSHATHEMGGMKLDAQMHGDFEGFPVNNIA